MLNVLSHQDYVTVRTKHEGQAIVVITVDLISAINSSVKEIIETIETNLDDLGEDVVYTLCHEQMSVCEFNNIDDALELFRHLEVKFMQTPDIGLVAELHYDGAVRKTMRQHDLRNSPARSIWPTNFILQ